MQSYFFLVILVFCPVVFYAQLYPLKPQLDTLKFSVIEKEGKLDIDYSDLNNKVGNILIEDLKLSGGHLVLYYEYDGRNSNFTMDAIKVIGVIQESGNILRPKESEIEHDSEKVTEKKGLKGSLLWVDATEKFLILGQSYRMLIERNIRLDVDCEQPRPQFDFKEQWPHYAVGAGGLASVGLGLYFRKEKEKAFDEYKELWKNGNPGTEADHVLEDANRFDTNAKIFTYGGIAIITADAIWAYLHWKDVKRRQQIFDEFCVGNPGITFKVKPSFDLHTTPNNQITGSTGIRLAITF